MTDEYCLPDDAFSFMLEPSQDDSSQENGDFHSSIIQDSQDPNPNLTAEETLNSSSPRNRHYQPFSWLNNTTMYTRIVEDLESAMGGLNLSNNNPNNRNTNTASLGLYSETDDRLLNLMRLRAAAEAVRSMQLMQGLMDDPHQMMMPRSVNPLFNREQLFRSQPHHNNNNNNNNNQPLPRRGHVLLMAKDQGGCRFLQAKIAEGKPEVVEVILSEVKSHVHELMTHPYGNYLVQKIFQESSRVSEQQKDSVAFLIISNERKMGDVCKDDYGTWAIQAMLVNIKQRPRTISVVVDAMRRITAELMKNVNGSYVIQRCVEIFPPSYKQVFLDEVARNCVDIATDKVGCSVIQNCLRLAEGVAINQLVRQIIINAVVLADHPYGNYVVQFIVKSALPSTNEMIIEQLRGKYVRFSMNKHASNVVESLIEFSEPNDAAVIVREIMESSDFLNVLQDPFGNYVAQKALRCTKGRLHGELSIIIFSNSGNLHSHPYGKRVLLACAKGRNRFRV